MHTQVWTNWLKLLVKQPYKVWHETEASSIMNGVVTLTTVGRRLLLIGPMSAGHPNMALSRGPMLACRSNTALSWWPANGGPMSACRPPKQRIDLNVGQRHVDIQFMQCNEEMQMICADVYSHFSSSKLNSVVNLWEKQKINDKHVLTQGWREWMKLFNC